MRRMAVAIRIGTNADKSQFHNFMEGLDGKKKQRGGVSPEFLDKLAHLNKVRGSGRRGAQSAPPLMQRTTPNGPTSSGKAGS